MKIVLVYPPLATPTQPYLALPALKAYLHTKGWKEIYPLDVNIEYVQSLLTVEAMEGLMAQIEDRFSLLGGTCSQDAAWADEYELMTNALLKAPFVLSGIAEAVHDLKAPSCCRDLLRLSRARRMVHEAMEILSASTFPLVMSFTNRPMSESHTFADLKRWSEEESRNPFRAFYAEQTLPRLQSISPRIVGISISYRSQVLGATTLASMIRKSMPEVQVVFGGNLVSFWEDRIEEAPGLFDWCHQLIAYEGETAMHELLTALKTNGSLEGVPNLLYKEGDSIKRNPMFVENLNHLPPPDYEGLPLDRYLAPYTVFSLYTSRGCYWGRCRFCAVSPAMRLKHRRRCASRIQDDITHIVETYGGRYVTFVDDCAPSGALREIGKTLIGKGYEMRWQTEVRFDPSLTSGLLEMLKASGCMNLSFGLESVSGRVRELMGKGTQDEDIQRILADCDRLGIAVNLQFFFGFPGERPDEAEETADFALSMTKKAVTLSFGTFELQKGSILEREPTANGITTIQREGDPLAVAFGYAPVAPHAKEIKERLLQSLRRRMVYPYAGLSLDAHTLIFLDIAKDHGLKDLYQDVGFPNARGGPARSVEDLRYFRLIRGKRQNIGLFYLLDRKNGMGMQTRVHDGEQERLIYDHDLDQTLSVSPVALWVLQEFEHVRTLADLIAKSQGLGQEASLPDEEIAIAIQEVARALYERGFLVEEPETRST